jgi:hypothetical protein
VSTSATAPNTVGQPLEEGPARWLLKRRYEELGAMFRAVWDNYIKFYTVFLTFNLTAMGFLVLQHPTSRFRTILVIVFTAKSLLVAVTSARIAIYARAAGKQNKELEESLLGSEKAPPVLTRTQAMPVNLAVYAGWANCGAMIALAIVWIYFLRAAA